MLIWSFEAIWEFVKSSATIATLIGCAGIAVAVLEPVWLGRFIPHLRTAAIYTAIAAFSYTTVAGKFYHDGLAEKKAEWDRALAREIDAGDQARSDAVSTVGPVPADRSVFRSDPNNRDRKPGGPLRWLEKDSLLGR